MENLTKQQIDAVLSEATEVTQDILDLFFKQDLDDSGNPNLIMYKLNGLLVLAKAEGYVSGVTSEL